MAQAYAAGEILAGVRPWLLAAMAVARCLGAGAAYTCESGEMVGEVQGETGNICAPRCVGTNYDCPGNVPPGVTAKPQCMLYDVNQVPYCGLFCEIDSQCPSGAVCKKIGSPEVRLCIHPLSFSEWVMGQGQRIKLAVGFATGAARDAHGMQLARAHVALEGVKRRFSIPDSDSDLLAVREFLTAATTAGSGATPQAFPFPAAPPPGGNPAAQGGDGGGAMGAWRRDVNYFVKNLESGVPGVERELHDTVWNLEHVNERGVCQELLRSIIMLAAVYLIGGCIYKNQAMGAIGIDMIPHVHFWMSYPALVNDGVKYAQLILSELLGSAPPDFSSARGGGAGGFLGGGQRRGDPDRDTFANFEPIK